MDIQVMKMDAAASSADVLRLLPQQKYDVFLSFRGEDTRRKFTSHLHAALKQKKIYTYIDYRLERGDEIGPALLTAIEQSKLSVIIFSKDYASSSWCLDEVVHILKCKQAYGQLVIPVFYDIDPSYVRRQQGTYADAFAILEEKFKDNMEKVRKWRDALTTAANLSGVHSQNIRFESELVETIVKDILMKLNRDSSYVVKGLVGMESRFQQIEWLLCINTQDVCYRTIGIWGMGGVGKTTLADAVFHRNSSKFDACLFVANVRERSGEIDGLNRLRNELLRKLLKKENLSIGSPSIGSSYIIDRLSRTKVLVVLDDVSDSSQLETLLGDQVKFGRGSRIIITTRNRRLLKKRVHEDHIYEMTELSNDESLHLFQSIAFEDHSCITDYSDLSREVVGYAGRNPLAVKVLASPFLHCNNREDWEEELNKLKKFPNPTIQNVMRISYNGLEENEKGIFLDIACFLKGESMCDAKNLLEMHGFSASTGIQALIDMSLISIKYNCLQMHDLLQEMGRAIDRGIEEPGKCKRLWNAEDAYHVLQTNTGTSTVEAIILDVSKIRELQLIPAAFRNMHNLKLLKIYDTQEWKRQRRWSVEEKQLSSFPQFRRLIQSFLAWVYRRVYKCDDEVFNEYCKVYLPRGLESLPEDLRYLYWESYPLKSLPSQYSPRNLVELHLPHSQVKQLWNNVQNLGSLKHLNLSDSPHLIEVPDLSGCSNIERINLSGCTNLVEVPDLSGCSNIETINLSGCTNLVKVSDLPGSPNIETINLSGCTNLVKVPDISGCSNIERINLSGCTNLVEVPDLSGCSNIERINLSGCTNLVEVPSYFQNLENLTHLDMMGTNVRKICELPCNLEELLLSRTPIEEISPSIWSHEKLHTLDLGECRFLKNLPSSGSSNSGKLKSLVLSGCPLESVPDNIYNSNYLETLHLSFCSKLKRLPPLSVGRLCCLRELYLGGCRVLESIPDSLLSLYKLEHIDLSGTMIESIPSCIIIASELRALYLTNCKKLKVIPELPWQLATLEAGGCTSLKSVASSWSALMQPPWVPYESIEMLRRKEPKVREVLLESVVYTDCLELDESARSNIMGDARLIIMRMAALEAHAKFIAICPGNEIPEWFSYDFPGWFSYDYEWEGCELNNIQFPKTKTRGKGPMKKICLNFVVSAVIVANSECALPDVDESLFQLVCDCNFKTNNDGEGYTRVTYESPEFSGPTDGNGVTLEEDHVVTFWNGETVDSIPWFWCEENSITRASFHLYPEHRFNRDLELYPEDEFNRDEGRMRMKVKKCGIRILYWEIDYESPIL